MKLFRRFLLSGWVLLFTTVGLCFAFPKPMSHFLGPIGSFFVLIPIALLLGTAIYAVMFLFRAGMRAGGRYSTHFRGD